MLNEIVFDWWMPYPVDLRHDTLRVLVTMAIAIPTEMKVVLQKFSRRAFRGRTLGRTHLDPF